MALATSNLFSVTVQEAVPTWASAIAVDSQWSIVGDNSMGGVSPDNTYGLTKAWCGAAIDTTRKEMVNPLPGGHGSRSHSDLYVFRFMENVPRWYRLRTGTEGDAPDQANGSNLNTSGEPTATHTYHRPVCAGGHVWLPGCDSVSSSNGWWTTATFSYPLAQNNASWRSHGRLTTGAIPKWLGGGACYDSVTDRIFSFPQACDQGPGYYFNVTNRLAGADIAYPGALPGATAISGPSFNIYNVVLALADLRLLVMYNQNGQLWTMNLDNIGGGWTAHAQSGVGVDPYGGGFCYHTGTRKIYGWANTGNTVRRLTIPNPITGTWTWANVATGGLALPSANADPPANGDNGCWGRFNVVTGIGGRDWLVYYPRWTHVGMYVLRLPAGGL